MVQQEYPQVPVACLKQIADGLAKAVNPQDDFFSQAAKIMGDLLDPTLWKRTALGVLGASLIVVGIILYTRPSAVGTAASMVREAV